VLVDYALAPEPANTITTTGIGIGGRYTFERGPLSGLSLFARYFKQEQQISTDQPELFVPNNIDETTVGVEYRIGDFTLSADHVWHDSTLDPYDATHVLIRYARRFREGTTLAATVAYSMIEYQTEPRNHIDLLTIAADAERRFGRQLRGRLTILYRDEDDSVLGHTRGLEETLELRWQHRQTQVFIMLRNANYETDVQDRDFQFFQVGLRRDF
jgi:predicted porin